MENSNSQPHPTDPDQPLSTHQNLPPTQIPKSKPFIRHKEIFYTTDPSATYSTSHNQNNSFKPTKSLITSHLKIEFRLSLDGNPMKSFPKIFNTKISHHKSIKSLHIIFNGSGAVPTKLYPAVISFINSLKSLKEISIAFEDDLSFNWTDLEQISKAFKKMKRITKFHISMDCFGLDPDLRFEEKTMKRFNARLQNFLLLKEFSFEFNIHPLSCSSISSLFKNLMKIKPLKIFRLILEGINDQTAASLCFGLKKLTTLESVILTLYSGVFEDDGVTGLVNEELFIDALKEIKSLANFEFNYYFQAVNPSAINQFFKRLSELENLKRLHLYTSAMNISDQSMINLAAGIKSMKKLNKLYIGFDGYVGFCEEKLETLSESLKTLRQLNDFGLEIPGVMNARTHKLDGAWLNKLLRSLHKNLKYLNITVRIPVIVTKEVKDLVVERLEDLNSLEKLILSFMYTGENSRMMIDDLVEEVSEKLEYVTREELRFEKYSEDFNCDDMSENEEQW